MADWLIAEADRIGRPSVVTHIYPAETVSNAPPLGVYGGNRFFPEFTKMSIAPPFVAILDGGELRTDAVNAALIAPEGRPIWDLSHWHELRDEHDWLSASAWPPPETMRGSLAPIIVQPGWSRAYYHWMFEILPRIHLAQTSAHHVDRFALHSCQESFQLETLGMLGVTADGVLELTTPRRIHPSRLVLTPVLEALTPHWVCDFLRQLFFDPQLAGTEQSRRIYISRAGTPRGRPVANEDALMAVLSPLGFESVRLEDLKVREQADLFASAEAVVGPHGAGFTNLVFCQPNTTVVEFFNHSYVHPLYWMLSNRRQLRYYAVISGDDGRADWRWWPAQGGTDPITVDSHALVELLRGAGIT